ncbi:uncharacterized protein LOC121377306 isoform X1 [Gigantopelta aegis]|uniref:uncharacterized protein LOC121377306 isoform X1 n=1 Tax=Gigantopelta aegis TaxID=1735272 RepID=UPI001B88A959|nr:uncharacterized protein LOC121377306 isoform X1 [Gigantopelta aegis]
MRLYYSFIADSMMLRFRSLSEGPNGDPNLKVRPLITGLLILDNPLTSGFTSRTAIGNKLIASKALDAFNDWVKRQRGLPPSDHWMLFTGYNLVRGDGTDSVAGLAVLGGLCSRSAVSVVEQSNSGSLGATATHELAHSLGARHDGEDYGCYDDDNYIMSRRLRNPRSERLASRPWQFSKCSVWRIKRFLRRVTCTLKDTFHKSVIRTPPGVHPGQIYKADVQCRMVLRDESYYGRYIQYRKGLDSMCRAMYCFVPGTTSTYRSIFPFEKTSCGDGKWCEKGRCVHSLYAPRTAENCPQGDDPNSDCSKDVCRYIRSKSAMASTCCSTCGIGPVLDAERKLGINLSNTGSPSLPWQGNNQRKSSKTELPNQPQQGNVQIATSTVTLPTPSTVDPVKKTMSPSNHPGPVLDLQTNSSADGVSLNSGKRMWDNLDRTWNSLFGTHDSDHVGKSTSHPSMVSTVKPPTSSRTSFWDTFFSDFGIPFIRSSRTDSSNPRRNPSENLGLGRRGGVFSDLGSGRRRIVISIPRSSGVSTSDILNKLLREFGSGFRSTRRWRVPGSSLDVTVGSPRTASSRRFGSRRRILRPSSSMRNGGKIFRLIQRTTSSSGSQAMNLRRSSQSTTIRRRSRIQNRPKRMWLIKTN